MKRGFTLVELAIVIVVVSLVLGGILAGRSIMNNSRLNAVTSEFNAYVGAIQLFQGKYNALPGDFSTASTVFVDTSSVVLTGVTNGDGSGTIVADYTANPDEMYQAWLHLRYGELIEGNYSGSGASWAVTAGTNVPRSRLQQNAGWLVLFIGYRSSNAEFYDGSYGHVMMLASNGYTTSINAGVMTPEDLRSIDEKMDDGAASTGTVRSTKNVAAGSGFQNGCVNGSNAYDTTLATSVCVPVFIAGF